MSLVRNLLVALGLAVAVAACHPDKPAVPASAAAAKTLVVSDPWAGVTPNGAHASAGYLTIENGTDDVDRLLSASSPRARRVEIHQTSMEGEMMEMRSVSGVDVPAHGKVKFAPGGYHLMLVDLTAPLMVGEQVPVELTFKRAGVINAALSVTAFDAEPGMADMKHGP